MRQIWNNTAILKSLKGFRCGVKWKDRRGDFTDCNFWIVSSLSQWKGCVNLRWESLHISHISSQMKNRPNMKVCFWCRVHVATKSLFFFLHKPASEKKMKNHAKAAKSSFTLYEEIVIKCLPARFCPTHSHFWFYKRQITTLKHALAMPAAHVFLCPIS